MKLDEFHYEVRAQVSFTSEEIDCMLQWAGNHYDSTCQEAASVAGVHGARTNGYIAQLRLFPNLKAVWTSRQIDLTLKILEPYTSDRAANETATKLFRELHLTYRAMEGEYKKLNGSIS